jgi:hypothetical protein
MPRDVQVVPPTLLRGAVTRHLKRTLAIHSRSSQCRQSRVSEFCCPALGECCDEVRSALSSDGKRRRVMTILKIHLAVLAMGLAVTALASPSHARGAGRETGSESVAPVPEWEHRRDFRPTTEDWWTRRETGQKRCYWTGPGPRGTYRCT